MHFNCYGFSVLIIELSVRIDHGFGSRCPHWKGQRDTVDTNIALGLKPETATMKNDLIVGGWL